MKSHVYLPLHALKDKAFSARRTEGRKKSPAGGVATGTPPAGRSFGSVQDVRRRRPQLANGCGRTWNFSIPGFTPTPPSMCQVTAAP